MAEHKRPFDRLLLNPPSALECESCKGLLEHGGLDVRWDKKPALHCVRRAAQHGCHRCQAVWGAVSTIFPEAEVWGDAVVYGLLLSGLGGEKGSFRVGLLNYGRIPQLGMPQEWIDIYEDDDQSK